MRKFQKVKQESDVLIIEMEWPVRYGQHGSRNPLWTQQEGFPGS